MLRCVDSTYGTVHMIEAILFYVRMNPNHSLIQLIQEIIARNYGNPSTAWQSFKSTVKPKLFFPLFASPY